MRQRSWLGPVLLGLVLVLLPASVRTTGALFSDVAPVTSGALGAGPAFVPPSANALTCSTTLGLDLTLATAVVTPPTRTTVEYLLRVVRTDVTPNVPVLEQPMTVNAGSARTTFSLNLLPGVSNARYRASVTTRLSGSTRESSPAQTRTFTFGVIGLGLYGCGTA